MAVLFLAGVGLSSSGCGTALAGTSSVAAASVGTNSTAAAGAVTVSSVSPTQGSTAGTTVVKISGTNFSPSMSVSFGEAVGTITSYVNSGTVYVKAPDHAAAVVPITVKVSSTDEFVTGRIFDYVAPPQTPPAVTVSSVSPAQGSTEGTTVVKISGANFTPSMSVSFGEALGTITSYVNSGTVYARAPDHAAAVVPVTVKVSSTDEFETGRIFAYVAPQGAGGTSSPTISSVSPTKGSANQAVAVTVTGTNFQSGSRVRISGDYATNVVLVNSSKITATLPAMAAGVYAVEVVNPDNSVATLNNAFTYLALLTVSTTTLPSATVSKAYSTALDAVGGETPYTWSIAAGGLPSGIALTSGGVISGSPTKAGSYSLTAQVKDATGATAKQALTLAVASPSTSGTPPTGTALTACGAITKTGTYYLANDVTCTTQGFALNANSIVFNLNGHTITYGTGSAVVPAISICDVWYKPLPQSACGNAVHGNPQVYNGKIVQSTSSATFTPAVWIGQANGMSGGYFHDLTITIQQTGAQAFYGDLPGINWKIENNTINDKVTYIQKPGQTPLGARAQFQGVVIDFDNSNVAGAGNVFSGNTINGSPQGGIRDSTENSQITDNVITLSSDYSNDYGVTVLANGQTVSGNIISGRGRGIDAEASQFQITGNTITVHEEANNSEYGGCELDGSYGIRIKNYPTNSGYTPSVDWTISGNTVSVSAQYCDAHALQFTDLPDSVQGTVSNNSFTTTNRPTPTAQSLNLDSGDYGVSFDGFDQAQIDFAKNSFNATVCAEIANDATTDGANATVQSGQTWTCGKYTVSDIDLTGSGGGAYPQALTLDDSVSGASAYCGPYSMGLVKIGSYSKQCTPSN
ncbi:MAG: IPT/TIG domain-containing protein [Silvibacterium sp.]